MHLKYADLGEGMLQELKLEHLLLSHSPSSMKFSLLSSVFRGERDGPKDLSSHSWVDDSSQHPKKILLFNSEEKYFYSRYYYYYSLYLFEILFSTIYFQNSLLNNFLLKLFSKIRFRNSFSKFSFRSARNIRNSHRIQNTRKIIQIAINTII